MTAWRAMVEHGYWPKVVMRSCKRRLESTSVTYKYTEHPRTLAIHLIFAVVTHLGPGDLPKSHWFGVTCNDDGRVIELDLRNTGL